MLTKKAFQNKLTQGPLLLDGATGSNLMKAGMPRGCCTEEWILAPQKHWSPCSALMYRPAARCFMRPHFRRSPSP